MCDPVTREHQLQEQDFQAIDGGAGECGLVLPEGAQASAEGYRPG